MDAAIRQLLPREVGVDGYIDKLISNWIQVQ